MNSDLMRLWVFLLLFITILSSSVIAIDFVATLTPVSLDSGSTYMFTVEFNNTHQDNATEVIVGLPTYLTYIDGTNGTDGQNTFTNGSSRILKWTGNFTNTTKVNLNFNASVYSAQNVSVNITLNVSYPGSNQSDGKTITITNGTALPVSTNDIVTNVTPTDVRSGRSHVFRIVINNTNVQNATRIDIRIPSFLTYVDGSQTSTNGASFSNTSSGNMRWTGNISQSRNETFTFNATAFSAANTSENLTIDVTYPDAVQQKNVSISILNTTDPIGAAVVLNTPINGTVTATGNVRFSCNATDTSGVTSLSLYWGFAGGELGHIETWNNTPVTSTFSISKDASSLSDGTYNWNCLSRNSNGVTSFASFDNVLFVDRVGPVLTFIAPTPVDNASQNITSFIVNFTSNENMTKGKFYFKSNDNSSNISFEDNLSFTRPTAGFYRFNTTRVGNIPDGYYEYIISVNDTLNNTRNTSRRIYIDRVKPSVSLDSISPVARGSSFSVDCSATDNLDKSLYFTSHLVRVYSANNKSIIYNGSFTGSVYTIQIDSQYTSNDGSYTLLCIAYDDANNFNSDQKNYVINSTSGQNTGSGYWQSTSSNIQAGTTKEFAVTESKIGVSKVKVTVNSPVTSGQIILTRFDAPVGTSPAPNIAYRYIKLDHPSIPDSIITDAKIEFSVDNNWITTNKIDTKTIKLYRYVGGSWIALETKSLGSNKYEATSPGLSTFAIAGEAKSTSTGSRDQSSGRDDDFGDDTGSSDTEEEKSGGKTWVFVVIFLLIFGGVVGATLWYLNKKGVFVVMSIPERKNPETMGEGSSSI